MKKHKNLIRLVVITAALVVLGMFVYKYMQQKSNSNKAQVVIQTSSKTGQPPVSHSVGSLKRSMASTHIQSNSQIDGGCIETNGQCTEDGKPCCRHGVMCQNGYCTQT